MVNVDPILVNNREAPRSQSSLRNSFLNVFITSVSPRPLRSLRLKPSSIAPVIRELQIDAKILLLD
ncbi:MAG: hypothetical protein ACLPZJ_08440, partial [Terriglobales bacterium]